ncbi:MAG: 3'(2'),5'-bisphosphate nucleotidase CysQ [Desulfomicrobium sp.]
MFGNTYSEITFAALKVSIAAGLAILQVYQSDDFDVQVKSDASPLTRADCVSHNIIQGCLSDYDLPILSEEEGNIEYAERKNWNRFWLIDPLDGTKEFIKRNGEFTVNIALIEEGFPVLGVVFAPVLDELYFASRGLGAFKILHASSVKASSLEAFCDAATLLPLVSDDKNKRPYTIVGSRSHLFAQFDSFVAEKMKIHGSIDVRSIGSSLKICLVAEGAADVYPRLGPTMEWDTAAGHAVASEAGCQICRVDTGQPLTYNKADLLNPFFIVERM